MPVNIIAQILSLNIALFIFNFLWLQLILKKLSDLNNLKKGLSTKPEQVLVEANNNANQMLLNAVNKASEIISQSKTTSDNIVTTIDSKLEELVQNDRAKLEKQIIQAENSNSTYLNTLTEKLGQSMSELTNVLEKQAESSVNSFFEEFKDKTENSYTKIHKQLIQEYDNAVLEISKYKEEQKTQIDIQVLKLVKKITQQVLPSTFSEKLHEEIVLESIKKAKRDHVLTNG